MKIGRALVWIGLGYLSGLPVVAMAQSLVSGPYVGWLLFAWISAFCLWGLKREGIDPWGWLHLRETRLAAGSWLPWLLGAPAIALFVQFAGTLLGIEPFPWPKTPWLLVLGMVMAPLVEEVLFRGFLQGAIEESGMPPALGITLVTASFVAVHIQYDWKTLVLLVPIALFLSVARSMAKNLWLCIALHAAYNGTVIIPYLYLN